MILLLQNLDKRYKKKRQMFSGAYINLSSWIFAIKMFKIHMVFGIGSASDAYTSLIQSALSNSEMVHKAVSENVK